MKKATITENQLAPLPPHFPIATETGQFFEIPADGSLGLLALGYAGLMAWRGVRRYSTQKIMDTYSATLTQSQNET